MNINLQIDRILLENIDLSYGDRLRLQSMVESELSQLLIDNGLPPHLHQGITLSSLPTINISEQQNLSRMGQQIARSIYREIDKASP